MLYNVIFSHTYTYLILIPLAILEGPLLSIACGVGVGLGLLDPFPVYGILVFGDFGPDAMYYWIGRWGTTMPRVRKVATYTKLIRENFLSIEGLWRKRPFMTLLSAKLAYGFAPPFVVSAGLSGVPFRKFMLYSLAVSIPYLGILFGLGYGLSRTYGLLSVVRGYAPYVMGVIGALFAGLLIFVIYLAHKQLRFIKLTPKESNLIESNP